MGPQGEAHFAQQVDLIAFRHDSISTVQPHLVLPPQGELGGRHRRRRDIGNAAATAQHAAICAAGDRGGAVDSRHCAVASTCGLTLLCRPAGGYVRHTCDVTGQERTINNSVLVGKYWRHLPLCHTEALHLPKCVNASTCHQQAWRCLVCCFMNLERSSMRNYTNT